MNLKVKTNKVAGCILFELISKKNDSKIINFSK